MPNYVSTSVVASSLGITASQLGIFRRRNPELFTDIRVIAGNRIEYPAKEIPAYRKALRASVAAKPLRGASFLGT